MSGKEQQVNTPHQAKAQIPDEPPDAESEEHGKKLPRTFAMCGTLSPARPSEIHKAVKRSFSAATAHYI
jgi:hypothetical protein